jgi:hypothetical protein
MVFDVTDTLGERGREVGMLTPAALGLVSGLRERERFRILCPESHLNE